MEPSDLAFESTQHQALITLIIAIIIEYFISELKTDSSTVPYFLMKE